MGTNYFENNPPVDFDILTTDHTDGTDRILGDRIGTGIILKAKVEPLIFAKRREW